MAQVVDVEAGLCPAHEHKGPGHPTLLTHLGRLAHPSLACFVSCTPSPQTSLVAVLRMSLQCV